MATSGGDFLVTIRTKFESTGIENIAAQARAALAQLASVPNLTPQQRLGAVSEIRSLAEQRRAQVTADQLKANPQDASRIRGQDTTARAEISKAFRDFETGMVQDLKSLNLSGVSKQMRQELDQSLQNFNALHANTRNALGRAVAASNASLAGPGLTKYRNALRSEAEGLVDPQGRPIGRSQQGDEDYAREQALAARHKAEQNALIQRLIAEDQEGIAAQAAVNNANRDRAVRTRAATAGIQNVTGRQSLDLEAETAVRERIQSELRLAAINRAQAQRQTTLGGQLAAAEAENRDATRALAHARDMEARAEVQRAIRGQGPGGGTRFQNLQAQFAYRGNNRLPDEYQKLGQFVGSRALVTGGFAVAGAAMYGSVRMISEMVREAEELDKILNQVEAQLTAVGDATSFQGARSGIMDIARETGAQADEVASVFFQFRGAFATLDGGFGDTEEALRQTDQAMKTVAVTGLSLKEVIDSLTAVAKTFGTDIDQITDSALGLQERFGVLARETITFVADLAPVANQIGMSLEDTAALGAVAQQVSGRSGTALAEGFGRILPAIAEVKTEILSIYNLPQLQGKRTQILDAFALGDTGQVFQELIRDYGSLSKSQQQFVINTLGGRREAQVLIPVLENASKLTREWDLNMQGLQDSGKTDDYFAKLQDTVTNTKDRFVETAKQIGEALFSSGLAEFFNDVVDVAGSFVSAMAAITNVVGGLNQAMGGIPVRLLAFAGLVRALSPLLDKWRASSLANAAANTAQAKSQIAVTQAAGSAAMAVGAAAGADAAEGASSLANAQANTAQAAGYTMQNGLLVPTAGKPAPKPGPLQQGKGALLGGGRGGVPAATGLVGALAGAAPIFLAFEALSQFFQNSSQQAQAAAEEADKARTILDEAAAGTSATGESVDEAIARLREDAARAAASDAESIAGVYKSYTGGPLGSIIGGDSAIGGAFDKGVNFIGGTALNLLGGDGSDALRAASGQDTESQQILEQIAAQQSEAWADNIALIMRDNEEGFLEALKEQNLARFTDILGQDSEFTGPLREIFGTSVEAAEVTRENIARAVALALEGDQAAANMLHILSTFATEDPAMQALLADSEAQAAIDEAGGVGGKALQDIESLRAQYENQQVTVGTYVAGLREEREKILDFIEASKRNDQAVDPADLAALAEVDGKINALVSIYYQNRRDALDTYRNVAGDGGQTGGGVQEALLNQEIAQLQVQMQAGGGLNLQSRVELVGPMIEALQEKFNRELEAIEDPVERANRAAQGFTLPTVLQQLFVAGQLQADPKVSQIIGDIAEVTEEGTETYFDDLANGVVTTADSAKEVVLQILDEEIAQLQATLGGLGVGAENSEASSALSELFAIRNRIAAQSIGDPVELGDTGFGGSQEDLEKARQDEQIAIAEARSALDVARAGNDPVAVAQANLRAAQDAQARASGTLESLQAERQVVLAEQALEDANLQIAQARSALNVARAGGDPLAAAQARLQSARDAQAVAQGELAQIQAETEVVNAENALYDVHTQIAQARNQVAVARASGDPAAVAQANLDGARIAGSRAQGDIEALQAEAAYVNAMNAYYDAQNDIAAARLELLQSQVGRDPVRAAAIGVQIAQHAVATARGTAAELRAQGQLAQAQQAMQEALIDIVRAQSEQITAVAETAGNMIEVANEAHALAVYNLQQILADPNSGEAERIRAETEVIRTQAGKRDAEYNDRLGTIDFLLDMERISIGQAIEMLQSLAQIPELTEEQLRTIQQRIKSLRDEAGQDFQFNLPSVIDLPTLYSARRLNQSASMGMGYNDNRTISVSVVASTNANPQEIANAVTAAIGDPSRTGTLPKKY